ncbi:helix-turn-helix domain-containing protein [Virgibacillus sp. W0430]|uniref:helix-turn-helix domain-containing protein n=1 Tax=Virgibacillus sp. W0430 TaxID=3391580 RepID=UPI003F486DEA
MKNDTMNQFIEITKKFALLLDLDLNAIRFKNKQDQDETYLLLNHSLAFKQDDKITICLMKDNYVELSFAQKINTEKSDLLRTILKKQWEYIEKIQDVEYQLNAKDLLLYSSKTLSSSLRLTDVLKQILDNTLKVIEAADAGSIYLVDNDETYLIPKVTSGFNWNYIKRIRFKPGESITGLTYVLQKPMMFEHSDDVYEGMATIRKENKEFFDLAVPKVSGGVAAKSKSAMCCPFIINNTCYGVVSINNFLTNAHFRKEDLQLLEAVCSQASMAMERGFLFEEIENQVRSLNQLNYEIENKNKRLEFAARTHEKLTNIVLQQKGFEEIAETVAQIIDKEVIIYDRFCQQVASTLQGEREIHHIPHYMDKLRESIDTKRKMTIKDDPYRINILPAVGAAELKGLIVVKGVEMLGNDEIIALEQASTVVALELLKQESIEEEKEQMKGEFLEDVIENVDLDLVKAQAQHLGIKEGNKYNFISMQIVQPIGMQKKIKRLKWFLEQIIVQQNPGSILFLGKSGFHALICWNDKGKEDELIEKSFLLMKEWKKAVHFHLEERDVSGVIGRFITKIENLSQSYLDIRKGNEILNQKRFKNKIITYKDMGIYHMMMRLSKEEQYQFVYDHLKPLIEYKHKNKIDLLLTLEAYCEFNQKADKVIQHLHLHKNTYTYRLKRVQEILGMDLTDTTHYLNVLFCFRLMDTFGVKNKWLKLEE